ncbi:FAD-binding oxidoreductase [Rugamonas sp. A1-17]|nr:FAD-binding oxidoreductase [Rugamonas sp. A1-17]
MSGTLTDHGRRVHVRPARHTAPAQVTALQDALRQCRQLGQVAALRGNGCSSNGLSLSEGAIVDCRAFRSIQLDADSGELLVGGGTPIGELIEWLARHGYSLPVLPSNPSATLAGVLSAGGIGQTSVRHGPIAASVQGLTVVTPDLGEVVIDLARQPEWRLIFGSFGALGAIIQVRLRVQPGPQQFRLQTSEYGGVPMDEAIARLRAGSPDYVLALYDPKRQLWRVEKGHAQNAAPGAVPVDAAGALVPDIHRHVQQKEAAFLQRREAVFAAAPAGQLVNIWADFFVPVEQAGAFDAALAPAARMPLMMPVINVGLVEDAAADKFMDFPLLPVGRRAAYVSFGLYAVVGLADAERVERWFDALRETCLALGGRQYLHGAFPPHEAFLRRQFGDAAIDGLCALRRRVDRAALLKGLPTGPQRMASGQQRSEPLAPIAQLEQAADDHIGGA